MWRSALAVVAHPDDESFGLGAVLTALVAGGCQVGVLCLTHGEASTLHGVSGDLRVVRQAELTEAARRLGIGWVRLLDHPDGALASVPDTVLDEQVDAALVERAAEGLVVFDDTGVTGHPDHVAATAAARRAGARHGVPVLAWTLPVGVAEQLNAELGAGFRGRVEGEVDLVLEVDRTAQLEAVHAHPSQAVPGSAVWRRLELLGGREYLRWLVRPDPGSPGESVVSGSAR